MCLHARKANAMNHIFRWVGAIFAGVGAVLLIAAVVLLYRDSAFAHRAARAEGMVIDLARQVSRDDRQSRPSITYTAVIEFIDKTERRHEFAERISANPPRFSVGQHVQVLYDPMHPANAAVDDFWGRKGVAAIIGGVALIITTLGIVLLVIDWRQRRRRKRLLGQGRPIEADFLHIFRDERTSRNGDHPYRVVAQARDPATGRLRRFESDALWVDPSKALEGQTIRILIDPVDTRSYYMDIAPIINAGQ